MAELSVLQAIFLALIQGLTEFLPVSSSGHLVLPSIVLGWPDQGLAFDVAVHVGSLLAVCHYLRRDLAAMLRGGIRSLRGDALCADGKLGWLVLIATVPAGLAGVLLDGFIESHLRGIEVIAATTLGFGILLGVVDRFAPQRRGVESLGVGDALWVGCAQALALIPGTSRSGITMTAALAVGLDRTAAARFSFYLSVPLILAAGGLKSVELATSQIAVNWQLFGVGTAVAAVSAWLCIHAFLRFVSKVGMLPFALYRVVLGAALFMLAGSEVG